MSVKFHAVLAGLALSAGLLGQEIPELPRVRPYPLLEPEAYREAVRTGTRTNEGKPGAKYWQDGVRYELDVRLDPKQALVEGSGKLVYTNRGPRPIRRLTIHLRQNLHAPGAQRTRDVEVTGGMKIDNVRVNGERASRARVRDTRLTVSLPDPLLEGDSTTVELDWTFTVPRAGRAPRMGHEENRVFYLGYWYPQFAVRDDVEGWVADRYRGNGEFYMPYGDYQVNVTAPVGFLVRATGTLQNPKEVLTEKAAANLHMARTTGAVVAVVSEEDRAAGNTTAKSQSGELTWKFRADKVRDVAVSVADTYVWDATIAKVPGRNDPVMIHAVYEDGTRGWNRAAEFARHAIEYMSKTVYPYPWAHMTACEGVIGGGMEYPMMTIVGTSRSPRAVQGTIAHELIHMWFPMIVGTNEKRYAWQDEGFTSFFTALCSDDFWDSRTGAQRAIAGYAGSVRRGSDAVCMQHADGYANSSFGFASYTKCAAILHQLRGLLGDEAFFEAFRRYTADWAYKHPYPWDFFRSFSHSSKQDLSGYFRTWYFERWGLDQALGKVEMRSGDTVVEVVDRGLAMHPAVVEARYADGSTKRLTVPVSHWASGARKGAVIFTGEVDEVLLDPDFTSLDLSRQDNRWRRDG